MLSVVVVGLVLWRGEAVLPIVLVVLALHRPVIGLIAIAGWAVWARMRPLTGPTPDDEATALDGIVAELEGGASPRAALVAASRRPGPIDLTAPARMVEAGLPADGIARSMAAVMPHNGRLVAAAWALAGESGAPAAPIMRLMADRAAERGRLDRERRALTAQARATAWLIAGLPLVVLVGLVVTGRVGAGPGLPVIAAGVALQVAGLAVVVWMLRRVS